MEAASPSPEEFQLVFESYATEKYVEGLEAANSILNMYPNHAPTLSMKGLILNCMGRKSEAYEFARRGLKNDIKCDACWMVFASLHCSDRKYSDAVKCYRNVLRNDPRNIVILEELSIVQAQMRDLAGLVETRQNLLTLEPNNRMNWISFAVALHLNLNASKAIDILEIYEGTLGNDYPRENERLEHEEMLLYKVSLLEECDMVEEALKELHKKKCKIVDELSYMEVEVSLLVKLGRLEEGEKSYRALLAMNPDNYGYYKGLQKCLGLYSESAEYSSNEIVKLEALYKSLGLQYTRSSAVKRIPLDFLNAEKFREAADNYIRTLLAKGVPSLFSDLSPLYDHPEKADILEELALEIEHYLKTSGVFPGRVDKESPSTLMWTLFYLAQNYDRRGQYAIALAKIDEAIEHTPTVIEDEAIEHTPKVIDLYSVKSRILKHGGDLAAAAALADEARCLDPTDRCASSDCVKRMLQADQVSLAEKTAVLFTKDGEQHNNLHDMQCMWYELASGESYFRQGELGRALKNFLAVEKHYTDITKDQSDFFPYCLGGMVLHTSVFKKKKMAPLAFIDMLKFQDRLHSHPYFRNAAAGVVRCYVMLYDSPPKSAVEEDDEMEKLARIKKGAEVKNEESSEYVSKSGKRVVKAVDLDPHGGKLLQVEDPLLEATKYLKLLQRHSPDSLETHLLSFEVHMRRHKILLALQALKQLFRLDAENQDSHCCLIRFFHMVASMPAPATNAQQLIQSVLDAEKPSFSQLHGKSLVEANTFFLEKHKDSLMHRAAAAKMICFIDPNKKAEAIKLIEDSTNKSVSNSRSYEWKLKDCVAVHKFLGTISDDHAVASRWKVRCSRYFPYSTYFEGCKSSVVARNKVQGADQSLSPPSEDKFFPAASIGTLAKVKLTVLRCKSYDDGMEMIENMSKMSKKHFVTYSFPCTVDGVPHIAVEQYTRNISYSSVGQVQDAIRHFINNAIELERGVVLNADLSPDNLVFVDTLPKLLRAPPATSTFDNYKEFRVDLEKRPNDLCRSVDKIVESGPEGGLEAESYKIFRNFLLKSYTLVDLHSMLCSPYLSEKKQIPAYFVVCRHLLRYPQRSDWYDFDTIINRFWRDFSSGTTSTSSKNWKRVLKDSGKEDLISMLKTRPKDYDGTSPSECQEFVRNSGWHINDTGVLVRTVESMHADHEEVFPKYPVDNWIYMHIKGLNSYFGTEEYAFTLYNCAKEITSTADKIFFLPPVLKALKVCCTMLAKFHIHLDMQYAYHVNFASVRAAISELESCIKVLQNSEQESHDYCLRRNQKCEEDEMDKVISKSVRIIIFGLASLKGVHSIAGTDQAIHAVIAETNSVLQPFPQLEIDITSNRHDLMRTTCWPKLDDVMKIMGHNFIISETAKVSFVENVSSEISNLVGMLTN